MAVTKRAYTLLAPWDIEDLADRFRSAFLDAGLMNEWYDSFTVNMNGKDHYFRVLRVEYDTSKTYGTMHYLFCFAPEGGAWGNSSLAGVYVTTGIFWDLNTQNFGGTAKDDYTLNQNWKTNTSGAQYANSAVAIWYRLMQLNDTTTVTLYRYTSIIDQNFTWFFMKSGTQERNFHITPGSTQFVPWLNFNEIAYSGFVSCVPSTYVTSGLIEFRNYGGQRRAHYGGGVWDRGDPNGVHSYNYGPLMTHYNVTHVYSTTGKQPGGDNWRSGTYFYLPVAFNAFNSSVPTDRTPVFTDLPTTFYQTSNPPIDFGITFHHENNTMETQDIFQVTPGVEEWEILAVARNGSTVGQGASPLLVALVIGDPTPA